jgi:hypothetical protein
VTPLKREPQNAPAAIAGCAEKEGFHNRISSPGPRLAMRGPFRFLRRPDRLTQIKPRTSCWDVFKPVIGHHFRRDDTILNAGENEIIAGGRDSPFVFTLSIGQDAPIVSLGGGLAPRRTHGPL